MSLSKLTFLILFQTLIASVGLSNDHLTLQKGEYRQLSLTVAAPFNRAQSSFGHAYLRFSKNSLSQEDVVLEFVADVLPHEISYFRGVGLGSSYKLKTVLERVRVISYQHRELENRDLTNYELDVSQIEIDSVIENISLMQNQDIDYNFFFNNCSSNVGQILERSLKIELGSFKSNIPIELPTLLQKQGLIKKTTIEHGYKTIRDKIVRKYIPLLEPFQGQINTTDLKSLLLKIQFNRRAVGYLKLAKLYKEADNSKLNKAIRRLIYSLIPYELRKKRSSLFQLFKKDHKQIKIKNLASNPKGLLIGGLRDLETNKVLDDVFPLAYESGKLITRSNKVFFELEFVLKSVTGAEFPVSFSHPIKEISYGNNENVFLWDGVPISFKRQSKSALRLSKISILYIDQIIKGDLYLTPYLVYEEDDEFDLTQFKSTDTLSFINGQKINEGESTAGVCYGLVRVQEQLMRYVKFKPHRPKKSASFNLYLFQRAVRGESVTVPGFANIKEFTKSIDEQDLYRTLLIENQRMNGVQSLITAYFVRDKLDAKTLLNMKNQLSLNRPVKMIFRPSARRAEHAILIVGFVEDQNFIKLKVYDPNLGFNQNIDEIRYWIDKSDFSLDSTLYGVIDTVNLYQP